MFFHTQRRAAAAGRPVQIDMAAVRPAPVALGLVGLTAGASAYFALLFVLAQYEQQGLGRSPVTSGLILVPWVAAFGLAGQLVPRVPARMARVLPVAGSALLTLAYAAISLSLSGGGHGTGCSSCSRSAASGSACSFSTLIGLVMNPVEPRVAAGISGVSSTVSQLGGAVGVAGIGSLYLSFARGGDPARATHAAALAVAATAAVSLVATLAAHPATRQRGPVNERAAATETAAAAEPPAAIETGVT